MSEGQRDIRRGQLLIDDGEKPGHDRREAAEGAALVRQGQNEIQQGWHQQYGGSTDLHRDVIARHRAGMGPTPLQLREQSWTLRRESDRAERFFGANWQHGQAVRAQRKRGLERE